MLAVSKILPLPGPGLVKPQDQRLGSFVVWFNVAAPPWSKEGHLVGKLFLTKFAARLQIWKDKAS